MLSIIINYKKIRPERALSPTPSGYALGPCAPGQSTTRFLIATSHQESEVIIATNELRKSQICF